MLNFNNLQCPGCNSNDIIRWGFYERGIIFFDDDNNITSNIIKIQRVRCKSCRKTHALLPLGIIPYKQISNELILNIIQDINNTSIEKTSCKYPFHISTIKNIWSQFKSAHLSRLLIITKATTIAGALSLFINNINFLINFIISFNRCFMQIRLGCFGYARLYKGAPT